MTDAAFATAVARHRGELHRHCARMVGPTDAEDALQETLLRAWRALDTNRVALRPWLYRIATNVCCDLLGKRGADVALDHHEEAAPREEQPDELVLARETFELALLTALRRLPARQQATLLLRDVLRCSAGETASAMSLSVAATNSALQRARAGVHAQLGARRLEWASARPTAVERHLLDGLAAACG